MSYSELREKYLNKYPLEDFDGNQLPEEYEFLSENGFFIRRGLTKNARIEFPIESLEDINFLEGTTFRFLVRFDKDTQYEQIWTSEIYYNELLRAYKDNIPYLSISNSTTIDIPFNQNLPNGFEDVFKTKPSKNNPSLTISGDERDVGVEMVENLNTMESLIRHIDWYADNTKKELRPARNIQTNDEGVIGIGTWLPE